MNRLGKENLADYVRRIIRQKQLKLRQVERDSGDQITNGYVSGIINGKINNVSLEKLLALAKGLNVDPYELFAAAIGEQRQTANELSPYNPPDAHLLMELMQEMANTPDLMKMVHAVVQMPSKDRQIVGKVVESIVNSKRPVRRAVSRKHA
jgi:transcriptional regulator with XRE-family HTH domain